MVSLTAKMNSITWTGIEEDSEGERDGKGVKEYVGSPEAREAAGRSVDTIPRSAGKKKKI